MMLIAFTLELLASTNNVVQQWRVATIFLTLEGTEVQVLLVKHGRNDVTNVTFGYSVATL